MEKFQVRKNIKILLVIISIMCIGILIFCLYNLSFDKKEPDIYITILSVVKDLLVVFITIVGTNLLVSTLIEEKTKNQMFTEFMANDIIASPEFYNRMDTALQCKMYNALESSLYYKDNVKQDMGMFVRDKIRYINELYYFSECVYMVTCSIHDTYIEEDIVKEVIIKTYKGNHTVDNFQLIDHTFKTVDGIIPCTILSVMINGDLININENIQELEKQSNYLKSQYDFSKKYLYNKKLSIDDNFDTKITIKYRIRRDVEDIFSIFRINNPCKRFSMCKRTIART